MTRLEKRQQRRSLDQDQVPAMGQQVRATAEERSFHLPRRHSVGGVCQVETRRPTGWEENPENSVTGDASRAAFRSRIFSIYGASPNGMVMGLLGWFAFAFLTVKESCRGLAEGPANSEVSRLR